MISMSQAYSIRQLRKQGETVAEIARKVGVCRNTVYNCLAEDDLSPKMPAVKERAKLLDPHRQLIVSWLEEDRGEWRKQRHTAHRIWVRLTTEEGVEVGESTVRDYVRALREELGHSDADDYLDQRWMLGEAQADFGEAEAKAYVRGMLLKSGADPDIFDDAALAAAHSVSGGSIRRLNSVIVNALMIGAQQQSRAVDAEMVRSAAEELSIT